MSDRSASLANVLRRIDSVGIDHEPHWLTGRSDLWLVVGARRLLVGRRVSIRRVRELERLQSIQPVCYRVESDPRAFWRFEDRWFIDRDGLNAEQVRAVLLTRDRRRHAALSRAQAQVVTDREPDQAARPRGYITDELKHFVWSRDGGCCVHCGATSELQYDHVIPIALGGSGDANNLQILCGPCNRRKGVGVVVG